MKKRIKILGTTYEWKADWLCGFTSMVSFWIGLAMGRFVG